MYTTVASANGRSFYLAKQRVGGVGYSIIATFTNEQMAKDTAALLNNALALENGKALLPKLVKGARR